jgi:hypothetical protein
MADSALSGDASPWIGAMVSNWFHPANSFQHRYLDESPSSGTSLLSTIYVIYTLSNNVASLFKFGHSPGSVLNTLIIPMTSSLSILWFYTIVDFLFNPTCAVVPFFLLDVTDVVPPATVSSCGKLMATIYGNDTVAFKETSRRNFMRNIKKPNVTQPRQLSRGFQP